MTMNAKELADAMVKDIPIKPTLTDMEIDCIAKEIDDKEEKGDSFDFWYREFARAILRKAQDK